MFTHFLHNKNTIKISTPELRRQPPQVISAIWYNIDFDLWAIPYPLSKFYVNRC